MITLLDVPLSPYAQKVKLALLEKGLELVRTRRSAQHRAFEPAVRTHV